MMMNFDELKEFFEDKSSNTRLIRTEYYQSERTIDDFRYMVYSYAALPLLIKKIKAYCDADEEEQRFQFMARYVVEDDGSIWFAIVGDRGARIPGDFPKEHVPAHSDMNRKHVIASGDIEFSEDYQCITKITNSSGHFRPDAQTLVWPIAALLGLNAVFAEHVTLDCFERLTKTQTKLHRVIVPREQLHELVPERCQLMPNVNYAVHVYTADYGFKVFTQGEIPVFDERQDRKRRSCVSESFFGGFSPEKRTSFDANHSSSSTVSSSVSIAIPSAHAPSALVLDEQTPPTTQQESNADWGYRTP
jgi:hypothetical protein